MHDLCGVLGGGGNGFGLRPCGVTVDVVDEMGGEGYHYSLPNLYSLVGYLKARWNQVVVVRQMCQMVVRQMCQMVVHQM